MTSSTPQLFAYLHTHWDREWYLPFRQYQVRLAQVVDQVLDDLDANRYPCFCLDGQTVLLDDYLAFRPENKTRLDAYIRQGKLTVGPWYVAPDSFLVGGESLIRNLQRGIAMANSLGCDSFCGYLPDTFGQSQDMPTLLAGVGITNAMVWRGVNPANIDHQSAFSWTSPTGSNILAWHLTEGYFQNMWHDPHLTQPQKAEAFKALLKTLSRHSALEKALIPLGGDHLGPIPHSGLTALSENAINMTTPDLFMAELEAKVVASKMPLKTITGELLDNTTTFVLPGVYSARLDLKRENKKLEHRLTRVTEPLLALQKVSTPTTRHPNNELDTVWQQLLLNHPHDSICGCSVDTVHRENHGRFEQVTHLCDVLEVQAKRLLSAGAKEIPACAGMTDQEEASEVAPSTQGWWITNLASHPYTGVISLKAINPSLPDTALPQVATTTTALQDGFWNDILDVPMSHRTQSEVHGYGYVQDLKPFAQQWVAPSDIALPKDVLPVAWNSATQTLTNGLLSVSISPGGTLSVTDHQTNQVYSNWLTWVDSPEQGDSYNGAPVPGARSRVGNVSKVTLEQSGPLVGNVRLTVSFEASDSLIDWQLETTISLAANRPWIEIETRYTNTFPNHKLQARFETEQPLATVQAESHFSITERHYDNPNLDLTTLMPAGSFQELPLMTGPLQRFVMANGHVVITEGLTEYEVCNTQLGVTLFRGFDLLSKANTGVRGAQAGPPLPTPDGQLLHQPQTFRYAWMPQPQHPWQIYQATEQFYGSVVSDSVAQLPGILKTQPPIAWNNPAVLCQAFYWQPKTNHLPDGWILRLLNTESSSQSVSFTGRLIESLFPGNLTDRPTQPLQQVDLRHRPLPNQKALEQPQLTLPALGLVTLHRPCAI